jgi:hypothetical protein
LFVLKDASACNGKGVVVGMIKVGQKRLFLSVRAVIVMDGQIDKP